MKMAAMILALSGITFATPISTFAKAEGPGKKVAPALNASVQQLNNLKFRVSVNQPVTQRVRVTILNASTRDALYQGVLSAAEQKGRVFDLSQLADGTYVFEVAAGDQKFTQSFQLKTEINRVVLASN